MSSHRRRKLKKVAFACGSFATLYFLGFFIVRLFDLNFLLPEDWMGQDWHYIVACIAIICFLLYSSIVIRIYSHQSIPNPKFSKYMVFGVVIGILFVLWGVSLLMMLMNVG